MFKRGSAAREIRVVNLPGRIVITHDNGGSAFLLLATYQREDRAQRLSSPIARYHWGDLRI